MADPLPEQKEKLLHSINSLEAQRTVLGDDTVDTAIAVLQEKLLLLEEQTAANKASGEARRMVTILFIDLVGFSTSMAEKLDPEEWRQVIVKLHATLGETIAKHNGSVAQYLGDGLLAFFGSRQANEQDPENAIRGCPRGTFCRCKPELGRRSRKFVRVSTLAW